MLDKRLETVLRNAGFIALPDDKSSDLENYGLNSLTLALLIVELEREYKIKIPVLPLDKNRFKSLSAIETYLQESGAL